MKTGKQLNMWLDKIGQLYEEGKDVINSLMVYPGEEKLHTRAVEVLMEIRDIAAHEIPKELVWILVEETPPTPEHGEILGFSKEWVHPDFNPNGTRTCFIDDSGNFTSAEWVDYQDFYATRFTQDEGMPKPTHWMPIPSTKNLQ